MNLKRYVSFVVVFGVLVLPSLALAQGSGSTEPDNKKKDSFDVTRTVSGKVLAFKAGESLVINSAGERHKFKLASESNAPSDIKKGDYVRVTYRASDHTATEVRRTKPTS